MLVINYREIEINFEYPFRMFISGSSQSGKTTFAGKLLQRKIFPGVKSIHYYHPDYLETCPVNWHEEFDLPVRYKTNLPTLDELCKLSEDSCIILDDLYEECMNSKAIDYLFRVLSGKKKISVIIMSQRYYGHGRFSMNIRNNVNYTVLMRNTDARVNKFIARQLNVLREYEETDKKIMYQNILIDNNPKAMVSGYRVFQDILDRYPLVIADEGMKGYLVPENEFLKYFSVIDEETAQRKNENTKTTVSAARDTSSTSSDSPSNKPTDDFRRRIAERTKRNRLARKVRETISRSKEHAKFLGKDF